MDSIPTEHKFKARRNNAELILQMLSEDLEIELTDEKSARDYAKRAIREKRFI